MQIAAYLEYGDKMDVVSAPNRSIQPLSPWSSQGFVALSTFSPQQSKKGRGSWKLLDGTPLHRRRDAAGSVGHAYHSLELVNLE